MEREPEIAQGSVLLYRLYDVAWECDLAEVEKRAEAARRLRIERKRFGKALEFANPPVTVRLGLMERELRSVTHTVNVWGKLYDYGAMSIIFEVPVEKMDAQGLTVLARHLRDDAPLEEDFGRFRDEFVRHMKPALRGPAVAEIEESYTIYHIRGMMPVVRADEFLARCDLAALMLLEEGEPAPSEATARELLSLRHSYSDHDVTVIGWDCALVLDPGGGMDIPDLIEFANAQLLELRVYDRVLDREMVSIYEGMGKRARASIWQVRRYRDLAARVMRTVTEVTDLTEKVDNSLKVTEDVYYARLYASALDLYRVRTWESSIQRKLDIASRTYSMLYQAIQYRRSELLEMAIVLLIVVEIVLFIFLKV